jgi:hypothetical protein
MPSNEGKSMNDGYELFLKSQEMRSTPEFQRFQELQRFTHTLHIFETNYRELDRLLWFVCNSPAGDKLFRAENHSAWEQMMTETIRLLQNFVAAAKALVDHSRRLYERLYEPEATFPEYQAEAKKRFANSEVIQFVHGLRNFCLHYRTPGIGTTVTMVSIDPERFEKRVTLSKKDLLNFDWTAAASRFLTDAPESIDLRKTLFEYHASIDQFYNWFAQQVRILHAADYDKVSQYYGVLLSGKREHNTERLEQRLKAFEAGIGTPFDVLSPFMTPSDMSDISMFQGDVEKWIESAIVRVSQYLSVPSDTAPRLQAVLSRQRESIDFAGYRPGQSQ